MIKYVLYAVCTCSTLLTFWIPFQYRGIKEHLISVIASHYNDFNTQVGHQQCFMRLKLFLHSILDFLSKSNKNWYKWMFLLLTMLLEQEGLQTVHCITCWCQSPLICFTNYLFIYKAITSWRTRNVISKYRPWWREAHWAKQWICLCQ